MSVMAESLRKQMGRKMGAAMTRGADKELEERYSMPRGFLAGVRASLKEFDAGDPGRPWAEVKRELGL